MSKTYYAAKPITIQSREFAKGDVVGSGDVAKGEFTAAEGCERIVELGHVLPRLADGRIVDREPDADPPANEKPKGKPGRKPKNSN